MGSGKTYWGKLLSKELKIPFFDLDEQIVQLEQLSISDIFQQKGEEYFRFKEKEMLDALIEDHESVIISCGGGTPCFFKNIDTMKRYGRVLWLNTNIDTLVQRLIKEKHRRPLLKNISDNDMKAFIVKKMQERKIYYDQAHVKISEDVANLQTLLKAIQDA